MQSEGMKKVKCGSLISDDVNGSLLETPAGKLCEDELSLIFRHHIISTRDLLNFRRLYKSWRDAATRFLLQRDACYINLEMGITNKKPKNKKDCTSTVFNWSLHKSKDNKYGLKSLTELISNSPKFPSSNLYLHAPSNNTHVTHTTCYTKYPDLVQFFSLHGDKFKTLTSCGYVSQQLLRDILCTYQPKLECLDLSRARVVPSFKTFEEHASSSKWTTAVLPFKSLIIPPSPETDDDDDSDSDDDSSDSNKNEHKQCYRQISHLLLSFPSNLSCIKKVNLNALASILKEEKGHLIKSFKLTATYSSSILAHSLLQKLVAAEPKITKLTLELFQSPHPIWLTEMIALINQLFDISKDTLEVLTFDLCPSEYRAKIKICAMKKLKYLRLSRPYWLDPVEEDSYDEREYSIFDYCEIPAEEFFPALVKLSLNNLIVQKNCVSFFQFKKEKEGKVRGGGLPKLEVLEIIESSLPLNSSSALMPNCLPNICVLKISFLDLRVTNFLWTMFPLLEFMEMDIFFTSTYDFDDTVPYVHQFFTGIPIGQCRKLLNAQLPPFMNNLEGLKFLRVEPSICDLLHLKEFKIKFASGLDCEVLSHVTGAYAFLQMPATKFIISYHPQMYKGADEAELCFASIKPYVEILQEIKLN